MNIPLFEMKITFFETKVVLDKSYTVSEKIPLSSTAITLASAGPSTLRIASKRWNLEMTYLPCARLTLLRSTITTTNADAMFAKIIKCGGREVPKFESFSVDPSPSPPRSSPSTTPPPLLSPSSPYPRSPQLHHCRHRCCRIISARGERGRRWWLHTVSLRRKAKLIKEI